MTAIVNPLPTICPDNSRQIFSSLSHTELARSSTVSKSWQSWVAQDEFWNSMPGIPFYIKKDFKKYIDSHAITSYDALLKKYEKFVNNVAPEGLFRCNFPFNPQYEIYSAVGFGNVNRFNKKPKTFSSWIFMKTLPASDKEDVVPEQPLTLNITTPPTFFNFNSKSTYQTHMVHVYKDPTIIVGWSNKSHLIQEIQHIGHARYSALETRRDQITCVLVVVAVVTAAFGAYLFYTQMFGK